MLPFLLIWMIYRVLISQESGSSFLEKFGIAYCHVPSRSALIWIHAASVGEVKVACIVIDALNKIFNNNSIKFLLTTSTLSSSKIFLKSPLENTIHQFLPIDNVIFVRRFLKHWKPTIGIFIESELWPCLLYESAKTMPLLLINARLSEKSFSTWMRFPRVFQLISNNFNYILTQSESDLARFKTLGAQNVFNYGNIKLAATKPYVDRSELENLQRDLLDLKVVVAASTHEADEKLLFPLIKRLKNIHKDSFFIVVLRHPDKKNQVLKKLDQFGLKASLRSQNKRIDIKDDLYIVDSFGELGIFYAASYIAFIGGSFKDGGHNPLEAAHFNNCIVWGSDMSNFAEIASNMLMQKAAISVNGFDDLLSTMDHLLRDSSKTEVLGYAKNAQNFVTQNNDILSKYCQLIEKVLIKGDVV